MGVEMEVYCGTCRPEVFEIDLDSYGKPIPTGATDDQMSEAYKLLRDTMTDANFANDGFRNEDAVNGCIALHVMGYDAVAWFDTFCEEQKQVYDRWFETDLNKFMEHVERVGKYLSKWGPEGSEGNALDYSI